MNPATVLFVIRSTIRLAGAANDSLEQLVRDQDILVSDIDQVEQDLDEKVVEFFLQDSYKHYVSEGGPLAPYWDGELELIKNNQEAKDKVFQAYFDIVSSSHHTATGEAGDLDNPSLRKASLDKLSQWAKNDGPSSPWTRLGYTLADLALEYVGTNPSLVKEGGQGEKLIKGFVNNIREMIPDVDNPDFTARQAKYGFAERATSVFIRSGLKSLGENVPDLIEEKHFQELAKNTLNPLVEAFVPENPANVPPLWTHPNLELLKDTLLGPVTGVAIQTLAENQQAFLGKGFHPDKAMGAVTRALLEEAADPNFRKNLDQNRMLRIYKATLNVAVKRPELFVTGEEPNAKLAKSLLTKITGALSEGQSWFHDGLSEDLLEVTLETLAEQGPALIKTDENNPWEAVAAQSAQSVLKGLASGFSDSDSQDRFRNLFSREQAVQLGRVFLDQAARTPHMLTGAGGDREFTNIVAGVAAAMAKDDSFLLTGDDWTEIASVAIELAANNPDRLFKVSQDNPQAQLGTQIIQSVLKVATEDFRAKGRSGGALLFGNTLNAAIQGTLQAAMGNVQQAASRIPQIEGLMQIVNKTAQMHQHKVGAEEWLWLFRSLLVDVIDEETPPELTPEGILGLLDQR